MIGRVKRLHVSWVLTVLAIVYLFLVALLSGGNNKQVVNPLIGDQVVLDAVVADDPSVISSRLTLNLTDAKISFNKVVDLNGRVWVKLAKPQTELHRYDRVRLTGILDSGFGPYLATLTSAKLIDSHHNINADPLGQLRDQFAGKLSAVLPADQVGLGMGLIAGQKSDMNQQIQQAFIVASLTHILVASGYNLTILTRFCRRLLAKHSRLVSLILSSSMVLLFAGLVGGSASMTRAVLVSLISLVLWYFGRGIHPVTLLSIVAAITVAIDPNQIWGDVGWYLSFASFAGVLILAPLVNHLLGVKVDTDKVEGRFDKIKHTFLAVVVETSCAQLVAWPIIALVMGQVSIVGILSNLLVLPIVPLAMFLTFEAGLASWLLPFGVASALALPANWLLGYIINVALWSAKLPLATIEFTPTIGWVVVYYLVLVLIGLIIWRHTGHNFRNDNMIK